MLTFPPIRERLEHREVYLLPLQQHILHLIVSLVQIRILLLLLLTHPLVQPLVRLTTLLHLHPLLRLLLLTTLESLHPLTTVLQEILHVVQNVLWQVDTHQECMLAWVWIVCLLDY